MARHETDGKIRYLANLSPVSKPRHINSIFIVNAPILYIYVLPINTFYEINIDPVSVWSIDTSPNRISILKGECQAYLVSKYILFKVGIYVQLTSKTWALMSSLIRKTWPSTRVPCGNWNVSGESHAPCTIKTYFVYIWYRTVILRLRANTKFFVRPEIAMLFLVAF